MKFGLYVLLICLTFGLLNFTENGSTVCAELDKGAIKKAVGKYLDSDASDETKEKYLKILLKGSNAGVANAVKSALKKEATREAALDLAIALQLRGLFKTVKKQIATNPDKIVKLALISNDKGAVKELIKVWGDSAIDSDVYAAIATAFTTIGVDIGDLEAFYKFTDDSDADEARRVTAGEILAFQGSLDTKDPDEVALLWNGVRKTYKVDGQSLAPKGMSLRHVGEVSERNIKRIGRNSQVTGVGSIYFKWPEHFADGEFSVTVYFKVSKDFVGQVGTYYMENGRPMILGLNFLDRQVKMYSTKGEMTEKMSPDKWMSATYKFSSGKDNGKSVLFTNTTYGKLKDDKGHTDKRPLGFSFYCSKGSAVLANVEYSKTK